MKKNTKSVVAGLFTLALVTAASAETQNLPTGNSAAPTEASQIGQPEAKGELKNEKKVAMKKVKAESLKKSAEHVSH